MTLGLTRDDEAGSVVLGAGQDSADMGRIGPYRLIQPLGEGGMGVVHLALDPYGRAVSVKVLREHIAHDGDARDRLRREVETLALVQDPRVAVVLDADTEGSRPYIVTRYIHGPSLEKIVSESGPVQGEDLLRLGRGLWDALNAIHAAGVVHRDLKPANVLLLDGDPVVIDFGIAHVADDTRLTMTGLVMGTPGYLSPEVVAGGKVTEATDWWGWAATLVFAASGVPPFGRGPMNVVLDRVRRGQPSLSDVDQRLAPILQAALSPIPSERPHAEEVLHALDLYAAQSPPTLAIRRAIPMGGAPSTGPYPSTLATPHPNGSDPALVEATGQSGSVDASSPAVVPSRTGTMLALFVGVLGVASLWPTAAIGMIALWSLSARFADRSITALGTRRDKRGRRRSDVPVVVLSSPWHAIVSVVVTVLALVIPAVVAIGSTFSIALASAAVTGGAPDADHSLPVAAGGFFGLLMCWWGLGSGGLRRGSRSVLRALTPGKVSIGFLVGSCVLIGFGLGAWAWWSHGQTSWWPWSLNDLKAITHLVR